MSTIAREDSVKEALGATIPALRKLATYQLEPALARRLEAMAERKELLSADEHAELLSLVGFAQQRQIEKLQAQVALQRLQAAFPDLVGAM